MKTGSNRVFHDFFRGTYIHEKRVLIFFFFFLLHSSISTNARTHTHTHIHTRKPNKILYDGTYIAKNPRSGFICHFSLFFLYLFFCKKKNPNGLPQSNPNAFFQSTDGEEGTHLRKHPLMCQEGTPERDRPRERERERNFQKL